MHCKYHHPRLGLTLSLRLGGLALKGPSGSGTRIIPFSRWENGGSEKDAICPGSHSLWVTALRFFVLVPNGVTFFEVKLEHK